MAERKNGEYMDIEFVLKTGHSIVLQGVGIKVFDALRKKDEFDKHFIWGENSGVAVEDISAWRIITQYV